MDKALLISNNTILKDLLVNQLRGVVSLSIVRNYSHINVLLQDTKLIKMIILDAVLPGIDPRNFIASLKTYGSPTSIPVLLFDHSQLRWINRIEFLKTGYFDVITGSDSVDELICKIKRIILMGKVKKLTALGSFELYNLTARERQVAELLLRGNSKKDIAAALKISVKTVSRHIENIYMKYDVHDRFQFFVKFYGGEALTAPFESAV